MQRRKSHGQCLGNRRKGGRRAMFSMLRTTVRRPRWPRRKTTTARDKTSMAARTNTNLFLEPAAPCPSSSSPGGVKSDDSPTMYGRMRTHPVLEKSSQLIESWLSVKNLQYEEEEEYTLLNWTYEANKSTPVVQRHMQIRRAVSVLLDCLH